MENKDFLTKVKANREAQQEKIEEAVNTVLLALTFFWAWLLAWMFF